MTLAVALSSQTEHRLADKAKAAGVDLATFISFLLEAEARRPTLTELSGQIAENFKRTNMTDDELGDLLEEEKHSVRASRRGKPFAE
jgi:hypothetical protein